MPLPKGTRYRWKNGVRLAFNKSGKVIETKKKGGKAKQVK